jgi:hypothetical protein
VSINRIFSKEKKSNDISICVVVIFTIYASFFFSTYDKNCISSALTHVDHSESILVQFWSLHEARLNRCLALRHFEQRFKEFQCNFIQLYNDIIQLPDINTSLLLFECYRTDNNTREDIDQTLVQVDDLSQRAQVIISFSVILAYVYIYMYIYIDDDQSCNPAGK